MAVSRQPSRRSLTHQLWVHDTNQSNDDLILNPEIFPTVKVGDLIEITGVEKDASGEKAMIFQVQSLGPVKGNLTVSVRRDIAELFQFAVRKEINVKVVAPSAVSVDFIELTFKDQFVTGGEMWGFRCAVLGQCVYTQKKLVFGTVRAQVKELMNGTTPVQFGLITEHTKFAFRSRSARFFFLVQMSREMWEFAHDGHLYFEKAVNGFMRVLLDRWKALSAEHSVSIIFFSRTYFLGGSGPTPLKVDHQGRPYEDFYKVVMLDDCRQDLESIPLLLKREFCAYRALVDAYLAGIEWPVSSLNSRYTPENSSAASGNLLEAISLVLTTFEAAHVDPDLGRTNHNILVISAGNGLFSVDHDLAMVTKHRMIDLGLGCDLVCLAPPPLHVVPLFSTSHDSYAVPHWINISYITMIDGEDAPEFVPTNTIKADPPLRTAAPTFYVPHIKGKLATNPYFSSHFAAYDDTVWNKPSLSSVPSSTTVAAPLTPNRPPALVVSPSTDRVDKEREKVRPEFEQLIAMAEKEREEKKDLKDSLKAPAGPPAPLSSSPHAPPKLSLSGSGHNISIAAIAPVSPNAQQPPISDMKREARTGLKSSGTVLFALPAKTSTRPRVSPFLQEVAPPGPSSIRRRWAHLVPVNLKKHEPNWKSLTEPACLPCTTDYFPPATELNSLFKQSVFQLSIPDESKTGDLLRELINQRLDRGYQLILQAAGDKEFYLQHGSLLNTRTRQIRIGLGRTFQLLTFDSEAQNIEVKRYYRDFTLPSKRKSSQTLSRADSNAVGSQESGGSAGMSANSGHTPATDWARINASLERDYTYALCTMRSDQKGVRFEQAVSTSALQFVNAALYNWNYLDELICGYNTTFTPAVRYNRVRMLVLPMAINLSEKYGGKREGMKESKEMLISSNGSQDDEDPKAALKEARITQFEKLRELLKDKCVVGAGLGKMEVQITPARKSKTVTSWNDVIAAAAHPRTGLAQRSGSFSGSDLVDWLLKNMDGLRSVREEALRLGQHMVDAKIIRQQADKKGVFQDSKTVMYRWKKSTEGTGPKQEKMKSSWLSFFGVEVDKDKPVAKPAPQLLADTAVSPSRYSLKLAKLDMNEDKKQDRSQWLMLQYDSVYDPEWAYALEFQWVCCSASAVEEFLVRCQRRAKSLGLNLVQVPSDFFVAALTSPFRRSHMIPFASIPDLTPQESSLLPLLVLQRFEFNYLIRPPPSPSAVVGKEDPVLGQNYIHKSGVALVRVGREGFVWDSNELLSSGRQIGPEKCPASAAAIYTDLVEFTSSAEKLKELLASAMAKPDDTPPAAASGTAPHLPQLNVILESKAPPGSPRPQHVTPSPTRSTDTSPGSASPQPATEEREKDPATR